MEGMKWMNEQPQDDAESFLPDFCSIRVTFAIVMAAELLAIVLSIVDYAGLDNFWSRLSMLSLYIQWIALGSAAILCVLKPLLKKMAAGFSGFIALLVLMAVTWLIAHISIEFVLERSISYAVFLTQSLSISFIVGILSLHYFYMQYRLGRQQQAESEARFQALQARIRPHFLFNSMNTIAHLTRADPEKAEAVVENLADLFRATMEEPGRVSTMAQEIELARGYLDIESIRLGDRLLVNWQVDDAAMSVPLPSMMLQPLLENAVYHGVENASEGGEIFVRVECLDNKVVLQISNSLSQRQTIKNRPGNQMAQENIRQRLMAYFGSKASFEVEEKQNQYLITMIFPVTDT